MTLYWVRLDFLPVTSTDPQYGSELEFLGQPFSPIVSASAALTVSHTNSGFIRLPLFNETVWPVAGAITGASTTYVSLESDIGTYFVAGTQPDPTKLEGPTSTLHLLQTSPATPIDYVITWNTYGWYEVSINGSASISINNAPTVDETPSGTEQANFTVTLTGADPNDTVTVQYTTQDGTAHAGTDYTAESGTVKFAPGQTTATISVPVIGHQLAQPTAAFSVVLSNPTDSNGSTPVITDGSGTDTIDPPTDPLDEVSKCILGGVDISEDFRGNTFPAEDPPLVPQHPPGTSYDALELDGWLIHYDAVADETDIIYEGREVGHGGGDRGEQYASDLVHSNLVQRTVGDGYLSGALIVADTNNDRKLSSGELSVVSDANGKFRLTDSGTLVATGGVDSSTGLPFKGTLTAPDGSMILTPLTTVLVELSAQGNQNAQTNLLSALHLNSGIDLTTLDPIAATKAGDPNGAAAFGAGAKVYDTVAMVASALAGAGGNFSTAAHDTFAGIAAAIVGSGINFDDKASVSTLISNIAQTEHITLGSGVADNLATVIAASNMALDQKLAADGAGATLLSDVAAIELIAQGAEATAIQSTVAHPDQLGALVNVFTGSNLNTLITNADNQVANLGQNQAPLSFDGQATTNEDTAVTGSVVSIDLNSDPLTYSLIGNAPAGLTLKSDGTFGFDPGGRYEYLGVGESASVSFQFKANDGKADSNIATETITITGVNDPPVASADSNAVQKGDTLTVSGTKGVLANDTDPDIHDHLTVASVNGVDGNVGHSVQGQYGSVTLNADGSYSYTANSGLLPSQIVPQDVFNYSVSDGHGGTRVQTHYTHHARAAARHTEAR